MAVSGSRTSSARLDGAFAVGNTFVLKPKGGPKVNIEIIEAEPNRQFTDLTRFPGARMYGSHQFVVRGAELEIRTTMSIEGPLAFVWRKIVAEHARIEPMTLSKAIRKLADDGLVVREQSAADSRAIVVRLTAKGRKLTQKTVVAVENADDEFFGRLSERQLETYRSLVVSLIEGNAG